MMSYKSNKNLKSFHGKSLSVVGLTPTPIQRKITDSAKKEKEFMEVVIGNQ